MKLLLALAAAGTILAVYMIWVRPYLRTLPTLAQVWREEDDLFAVFGAYLEGRKTLLIGVWGEIAGMAPDLLQIVSGVDLKTALSLPDNWALMISGMLVPVLMLIFRTKVKAS